MLDGTGLPWLAAVLGGDAAGGELARPAIERGGHLRVGLEDHDGPRQPRNEELVREAVALAEAAGRPVAAPKEAARIPGLPGWRPTVDAGWTKEGMVVR
jgi:3-keto-5-aminohexanoate cleavage enzyme